MLELTVAAVERQAPAVLAFDLVRSDGGPLPPFSAGAHIDVHLPGGVVRQYSLCNPCHEVQRYRIGVLAVPASRGGSRAMHALQPGSRVQVSEPRNLFALAPHARRSLLLAGGIGITPLLCMADHLQRSGSPLQLRYFTRDREQAAFIPHLQGSAFADQVWVHFDGGDPARRPNFLQLVGPYTPGDHLYVCGPAGFMAAALAGAQAQGWPESALHQEHFSAPSTAGALDVGFEVELASSGRVVQVAPQQTVVDALRGAGVDIAIACGQGLCGTCVTPVLAGEVDHRDVFLTAAERAANDRFTPCCSRAKRGRLVLGL